FDNERLIIDAFNKGEQTWGIINKIGYNAEFLFPNENIDSLKSTIISNNVLFSYINPTIPSKSLANRTHNLPLEARLEIIQLSESEIIFNYSGHRSEEHTSELQSRENIVCRLLLE